MAYVSLDTELIRGDFTFAGKFEMTHRVTGIFGPSGSGKTTLLHLLAGLQKPSKGTIQVGNQLFVDTASQIFLPAHKRQVGYVFQEGRVFPHMNVEANLKYGWKKNTHNQQYFDEVVDLLELRPFLKSQPLKLSGGEKQRIAIGRALMSNARLLLLDEPFTALDLSLKKQVISLLNRVIGHLKIPVIIVSHELKDLLMLTQNLILIKSGKPEPPMDYLELIRLQKLNEFEGLVNNYFNIYSGRILEMAKEKGITKVQIDGENSPVLFIETDEFLFHLGDVVKISLRGSDVVLSLDNVKEISIRNQLKGKVETIYQHQNHLVCIVDCGIRIITRLTIDAGNSLGLEPGMEIWCLFKSLAIEAYR
jgi:molybdate transport system ATP-binding protein